MPLPPFNRHARCKKCGESHINTEYVAGHLALGPYGPEEHLRRTCMCCKYSWKEATLPEGAPVETMEPLIKVEESQGLELRDAELKRNSQFWGPY